MLVSSLEGNNVDICIHWTYTPSSSNDPEEQILVKKKKIRFTPHQSRTRMSDLERPWMWDVSKSGLDHDVTRLEFSL